MDLACSEADRATVKCVVTCDTGYTYGSKTRVYRCREGDWDHYSVTNPTARIKPCQSKNKEQSYLYVI